MAGSNPIKKFLGKPVKFDYQAGASAPRQYPMRILGGSLGYHDDSGSLYVPGGGDIDHGWGESYASHITGPTLKPLPKQLFVSFFSYTENQFYQGRFDLPYDKILKMFQEGYYSPGRDAHITYDALIVGVAPGGAVAVWAEGISKTTEVFFGQAQKVEKDWRVMTDNTQLSREEYVRMTVVESRKTPEALAALKQNGVPIGLWDRYRTRYDWQPLFTDMAIRDDLIYDIRYFNGERDYLYYPLKPEIAAQTRPVPAELNFVWLQPNVAKGRLVELYFNEAEILGAFEKLGAHSKPLKLEMRLQLIDNKYDLTIWVRNDKEAIELKQTKVKTYNT